MKTVVYDLTAPPMSSIKPSSTLTTGASADRSLT